MKRIAFLIVFISIIQGYSNEFEIQSNEESFTSLKELNQTSKSYNCTTIRNYVTSFLQSNVGHLQGIAFNEDYMFLSYTKKIVKKDCNDSIVGELNGNHHFGDPTLHNGFLYVPLEKGIFNSGGNNDSYVYKIDPATMTVVDSIEINETKYGIGGMAYGNNKFIIIGGNDGRNNAPPINYFYEYDTDFNFLKTYTYYTGNTSLGLQVIEYNDLIGSWVASVYSGSSPYNNFIINDHMLIEKTLKPDPNAGWNVPNLSNIGFAHINVNDQYFIALETSTSGTVHTNIYKNQPFTEINLTNSYFIYQLSDLNNGVVSLISSEVTMLNTNLGNEYAISVDFKLPNGAVGSSRSSYFIAGGYDGTVTHSNYNGAFVFYPQSNDGNGAFKFFIKDSQNNQAVIETSSSFKIEDDKHYNLTATYDNGDVVFYANGELIGTSSALNGEIKDFTNFTIGATPSNAHQFGGEIWNLNVSKKLLVN